MSIASLWLSHLVYMLINAFIRQTSRYNPALVISVWICFPLSKAAGFRSIPWLCTLVRQIDIPMGTNMNTLLIQIVQQIHWCSMNLAGISMLTMPPLLLWSPIGNLSITRCIYSFFVASMILYSQYLNVYEFMVNKEEQNHFEKVLAIGLLMD
jgi:hypothetical protein